MMDDTTPATRASVAVHVLAATLLLRPSNWPASLALVFVNHLLLTAAGLWPRSTLLGPNQTSLDERATAAGQVAITIDDGPDPEVTPQVLEILDQHQCRATFFCIGERLAAHPELAREIIRRGHRIENHTQHHRHDFSLLGPGGMRREIAACSASIAAVTGERPQCFRAPAGLRNPFLNGVLVREQLRLVSWTRRGFDTRTSDPARVLERLTSNLRAGDILLLHDGHAARTPAGTPVIVQVLPPLLEAIAQAGLTTTTLDPVQP